MKITVFYVGSSLLAPLKKAEAEINRLYGLELSLATHNCGAPFSEDAWAQAERDIKESDLAFIIHVTEDANAERIKQALDRRPDNLRAVIAFNCMPALMRCTRMGKLEFASLMKREPGAKRDAEASSRNLLHKLSSWMQDSFKRNSAGSLDEPGDNRQKTNHGQYIKLINRLPRVLKFVPATGRLADIKHYLNLFCYFLQPTPGNIRSMLLYAIKHYSTDRKRAIKVAPLEAMPAVGIYHPDAAGIFETFDSYARWHRQSGRADLEPDSTIGLLLMRPQIISDAKQHYDGLIRSIEREGLAVIPAISTFMDNREASGAFFVAESGTPRVSQIVSLTGFSFVGGPAMNDSRAAVEFFSNLGVPFRSMVSLDFQTIDHWQTSKLGLNPIQAAMQVAIPEIDGATEPFIFGGLRQGSEQPEPLEDRCRKIARRLARWNHLSRSERADVRLAFLVFCFPPNKGNIGTAADLDVFPSLLEILRQLESEGYKVAVPESADDLREMLLGGNSDESGSIANVAYRLSVDQYRALCPYVAEIEREWGRAPGLINSDGTEILIHGIELGNVFVGVQPTFGYEGDPMRMLAAESGAPHHGFIGLYTYIEKIFSADAVIHVGTHGSLEFMPGKQVGLSSRCWPDRLIGELPNIYIYSVNNPSEGTIARRRSYAELVSYLTPPIQNAGLYKELAVMKELLSAYRQAAGQSERQRLYEAIEEKARALNL